MNYKFIKKKRLIHKIHKNLTPLLFELNIKFKLKNPFMEIGFKLLDSLILESCFRYL